MHLYWVKYLQGGTNSTCTNVRNICFLIVCSKCIREIVGVHQCVYWIVIGQLIKQFVQAKSEITKVLNSDQNSMYSVKYWEFFNAFNEFYRVTD